jgi:hypothetical protein
MLQPTPDGEFPMSLTLRVAICLLLFSLLGASGCKPFQPGSLSRMRQPLPTSEVLAQGNGAVASRSDRERQARPSAKNSANNSANNSVSRGAGAVRQQFADSAPRSQLEGQQTEHTSDGYCASCGVTHGANNGPSGFKFSQPLPEFQPQPQPQLTQPEPTSLPDQLKTEDKHSTATYSSAVRVRPLQPEESRLAPAATPRPAPQPQPDDEPVAEVSTTPQPPAGKTIIVTPVDSCASATATTGPASRGATGSADPGDSARKPDRDLCDSTVKLAAKAEPGEDDISTGNLTSAEESLEETSSASADSPMMVGEEAASSLNLAGLQLTLQTLRSQADLVVATELGTKLASELTALELLAQRVEQLAAGEADATQAQKSCQHQIAALVATLRPDALDISRPEGRTAASATLDHLRAAIVQLESLVSLKVTRGALCSEIRGFGQYKPFPGTELRTGQEVLLYCELENFCSTATPEANHSGFCTRLKSSLVICREDGSVAQQAEFPIVEDVARNRRRDFYLYVPFTVGELPAGKYRVHLLVDDLLGCKQAVLDPPVEFTVR